MPAALLTSWAVIASGKHLFPFRTEKLSLIAPMVLGAQAPGRVGRRPFSSRYSQQDPEAGLVVLLRLRVWAPIVGRARSGSTRRSHGRSVTFLWKLRDELLPRDMRNASANSARRNGTQKASLSGHVYGGAERSGTRRYADASSLSAACRRSRHSGSRARRRVMRSAVGGCVENIADRRSGAKGEIA